jgi:hypothetical protein
LVIDPSKRNSSQIAVGILSIMVAVSLAALLGWLAVGLTVRLTGTFEVIATIVGWILWPLRI